MTIRISFSDKTAKVEVKLNGGIESLITELPQRVWFGLMRGVRVEGDTVIIKVKGNEEARILSDELIHEMEMLRGGKTKSNPNSRRIAMFKICCGDCGKCWWIGNPRTCKCNDEKPVWDASASLVMTPNPAFAKREWVGLTDEEMRELEKQFEAERVRTSDEEYLVIYPAAYWQWQRAIEAKLKEKNT